MRYFLEIIATFTVKTEPVSMFGGAEHRSYLFNHYEVHYADG